MLAHQLVDWLVGGVKNIPFNGPHFVAITNNHIIPFFEFKAAAFQGVNRLIVKIKTLFMLKQMLIFWD